MESTEKARQAKRILTDLKLDDRQRKHQLASLAEGLIDYVPISAESCTLLGNRVICDLFEGPAPYRPRYILPDYAKALREGSVYLELEPPQDLDEALSFLGILYGHVPSITGYPVYLGDIDSLLEPFVEGLHDASLDRKLKLFWRSVDRLLPDAFVHANLGPKDSRVARSILRIERELAQVVPNLTLKVDEAQSSDELILEAVKTVLAVGKPHFVNHRLMVRDLGENYGVASCYNSLRIGGGAHTLVRLNLKASVEKHEGSLDDYLEKSLVRDLDATLEIMAARIRHVVEVSGFFEHHFLVREGLISLDRFSAMFGVFGLAEAVNQLLERSGICARYGRSSEAQTLAIRIIARISQLLQARELPYCEGNAGHALLHSQSGIDDDFGITPGTRIPFADEPSLLDHILYVAPLHEYFPAGISDIFHFEKTLENNPEAALDLIRGAFRSGMRDFTFDIADSEFVRITGYLARRTDMNRFAQDGSRYDSTVLASRTAKERGLLHRPTRTVT